MVSEAGLTVTIPVFPERKLTWVTVPLPTVSLAVKVVDAPTATVALSRVKLTVQDGGVQVASATHRDSLEQPSGLQFLV